MRNQIGYYWDRYSTQADAIIFGLFFGIGVFVQLIFRLWLNAPAAIVTLFLLILMGFYAYLIQANSATKTGSDRSGDTLYFLGFIFTTITLGIALFKIGGNEQGFATSIVLYDLGIGIATTIWGLVLRVIFSLMRTGTEEIENKTLSNLNQRAKSLSAKLARATQMAEETTVVVNQVLEETRLSLQKIASYGDEKFSKIYDETIEKHRFLLSKNTEAMQMLCEKIEKISIPADIVRNKLDPVFDRLSRSMDLIESRVAAIKIPENSIEDMAASALIPLRSTVSDVENALEAFKIRLSSLAELDYDSLSIASDKFKGLITDIDKLRIDLDIKTIDTEKFNAYVEESGKRYLDAVDGLASKISTIVVPTGSLQKAVESSLESYQSVVSETSAKIVDTSVDLKNELATLKNSLIELSAQVSETASEIKKTRGTGAI